MDRLYDSDQYGNMDTNNDGVINDQDVGYQTDTLLTPAGLGASQVTRDNTLFTNQTFEDDGRLKIDELFGSIGDTNNAMDDLLSSDKFNNGRVPDVSMISNVNKTADGDIVIANDNQQTGVKGILEETVISDTFLSDMNTKVIQDTIRYGVYQVTNMIIDYQSPRELYIIMRSIMLQHANFKVGQSELLNEIHKLNKFVVDYAVGKVASNVQQYDTYIKDIQTLPNPMNRPGFSSDTSRNRSQDMSAHIGIQ
jgi:hypothetical protein